MSETLTIPRNKQKLISFKEVPDDALFIVDDDSLCQKVDKNTFNFITSPDGTLCAGTFDVDFYISKFETQGDQFVKEILDIKKITFS